MKSIPSRLLPMFIAGLLLGGCSGLDDPDEDGDDDTKASDFNGTYTLTLVPPAIDPGSCSEGKGVMRLKDGDVTGEATDANSGESITLSGSVEDDGFTEGALVFSFGGNAGSYNGLMKISGSGDGTWKDTSGCVGDWTATK